jgi:WD40 repeat protein
LFSPDNAALASVDETFHLTLWDVDAMSSIGVLSSIAALDAIAFSPDSTTLAAGDQAGIITLWDVASGARSARLPAGPNQGASTLTFSADGRLLASTTDKRIVLWDVATRRLLRTLVGHDDVVADVAFAVDAKSLASVADNGQMIVWDVVTGTARSSVQQSREPGASPTGSSSAGGSGGASAQASSSPTAASQPDSASAISADSAQEQSTPGNSKATAAASERALVRKRNRVHDWKGLTGLTVSPDGGEIATSDSGGTMRIWDLTDLKVRVASAGSSKGAATGVAFVAGGKKVASVGRDSDVRLWNAASGSGEATFHGHEHPIRAVAASPDGALIASAGEETRVLLWDVASGKLSRILMGKTDFINTVAFSPDRKFVAAAGPDARITIWETATGRLVQTLLGQASEINAIVFSPDGRFIASAGEDARVLLWDVALGQQIYAFQGHQGPVRTIAFSRDGQTLASAGEDTRILIWDVSARKLRATLAGVTGFVNSVVFNASGSQLLSAGEDSRITRWNVAGAKKELSSGTQ